MAAPSTIQGIHYEVLQDMFPKMITNRELQEIEAFVRARQNPHINVDLPVTNILSEADVQMNFQKTSQYGRNNALFHSACLARNAGFTQNQTTHILLDTFIANRKHDETVNQRYAEGHRTLKSVFTRSPQSKSVLPTQLQKLTGLPNEIREKLLQLNNANLIRVWEALKHLAPNQEYVTEAHITTILQGITGKYSIRKALTTTINNKTFFQRTKILPKRLSKLCNLDTVTKSKKIKAGRKKYYYRIPTIRDFCRILDIQPIYPGDEIPLEALGSSRTTRIALHIGFIRRCPGKYPRKWLAKRLGITIRTLIRYNSADPFIHVVPVYLDVPVQWNMIAWLPDEEDIVRGTFFVDENSKRYPPLPSLARKLITLGRRLIYRRRSVNYYCYGLSIDFDALYVKCI